MPDIDVLDSHMHWEETGDGRPIVFLHGNPTSSYLWRAVTPEVQDFGRCLAPDLIGFGRSGKPDIGYRFADHAGYLAAWIDAVGLDEIVIVGHDWGGALGFDWAARHPDRIRGIAFMETIIKPLTWNEWPVTARDIFQAFRRPEGESLILDRNLFVEAVLPASIQRTLSDAEMDTYRAPFADREARRPTLVWPREIPIEGEPADVVARVQAYDEWLATTPGVPKLMLNFEPGAIFSPPVVAWCRETIAGLEEEQTGRGIHFVQEDEGPAIGRAVATWLRRHGLDA